MTEQDITDPNATKPDTTEADACYTCGESEDFCECSEGFDSTRDRERTNDFDIKFAEGDKVVVKHQREMGECVVVNPHDETDMVRVGTGKPVGFYVSINTPKAKEQGYHEENLERV